MDVDDSIFFLFFYLFFFFFKHKTAYEMLRGLVCSEMCIRDSLATEWQNFSTASAARSWPVAAASCSVRMSLELSLIHI